MARRSTITSHGLVGLSRGTQDEEIYAERDGRVEPAEARSLAAAVMSYTRLSFEVAGMPHCIDVVETREQGVALVTA